MLGSPIAHSLSPTLHRAAYTHLGLDWTYEAIEVREDELAQLVGSLDDTWRGLSLTMPLKRAAVRVATSAVEPVGVTGVANTLVLDAGRRVAHNTDVAGMRTALAEAGIDRVTRATVLGGGSTAAAAVAALAPVANDLVVVVRSTRRVGAVQAVADRVGVGLTLVDWPRATQALTSPVVVSTTPAGAADNLVGVVPDDPGLLFDVVYDPWPTVLAARWAAAGGRVLSGLDLLVHQAVGQVALMTGRTVPVDVLRASVRPT